MFRKIQESKKAIKVSSNVSTAMKLLWALWFWGKMEQYFGRVFPQTIQLNIFLNDRKAVCFLDANGHLNAFRDVFIAEEYKIDLQDDPETIVDLGSNIGLSVIYFKLQHPQAKVYAFEPHPLLFKRLSQNTEQFNDVFLHQKLVSDIRGESEFYTNNNKPLSSSIQQQNRSSKVIKVRSITLDDILSIVSERKVDVLKFDIEGAEWGVFRSFTQWDLVNTLVGELHYDLVSVNKKELNAMFTDNTKALFKNINENRSLVYAQNKVNTK